MGWGQDQDQDQESELAREQQRRAKIEEVAARRLEGELVKLHQVRETARQAEAALREQLTTQGIDLAPVSYTHLTLPTNREV